MPIRSQTCWSAPSARAHSFGRVLFPEIRDGDVFDAAAEAADDGADRCILLGVRIVLRPRTAVTPGDTLIGEIRDVVERVGQLIAFPEDDVLRTELCRFEKDGWLDGTEGDRGEIHPVAGKSVGRT